MAGVDEHCHPVSEQVTDAAGLWPHVVVVKGKVDLVCLHPEPDFGVEVELGGRVREVEEFVDEVWCKP